MKILTAFLLFSVVLVSPSSKGLRYDEMPALTWKDFKGNPDKKSSYFANTSSGFEFTVAIEGEQIKIFLPCYFHPNESWVKKEKETPELLEHEQLHLDITELNVRKMRKAFLKLKGLKVSEINAQSKKIVGIYSKESDQMQKDYDKETNHSINKTAQSNWEKRVEEELKDLDSYKSPHIQLELRN